MNLFKTEKFNNVVCDFYQDENGAVYLSTKQIGRALGYASPKNGIDKIYARHLNKLHDKVKTIIENYTKKTVYYSIPGILVICEHTNSEFANSFSEWVQDIVRTKDIAIIEEHGLANNILEWKGKRVVTSKQLAEMYGAEQRAIRDNFSNNKSEYIEGEDYFCLGRTDITSLSKFSFITNIGKTNKLYLWTESGALLHAKSINTRTAWDVYRMLMKTYFETRELVKKGKGISNALLMEKLEKQSSQIEQQGKEIRGLKEFIYEALPYLPRRKVTIEL